MNKYFVFTSYEHDNKYKLESKQPTLEDALYYKELSYKSGAIDVIVCKEVIYEV